MKIRKTEFSIGAIKIKEIDWKIKSNCGPVSFWMRKYLSEPKTLEFAGTVRFDEKTTWQERKAIERLVNDAMTNLSNELADKKRK